MNRYMKIASVALLSLSLLLGLTLSAANAQSRLPWPTGIEQQYFGHTFAEEYWTNDSVFVKEENRTIQLVASYVNYSSEVGRFQAMLVSLGMVEDENGTQSTLPYQMFGLHFTTPQNRDVFIGALLGFLYGFNDTDGNGVPSPGEKRFFIIPYGYNEGNTSTLVINAVSATRVGEGHYQFGISYRNLYARLVSADSPSLFWATLIIPLLELTLNELTITYDIRVNSTTGEITTKTGYTIGQVSELRFLTFPIPNHFEYLEGIGIGVAHFIVVFTSEYYVQTGSTQPVNATNWNLANITTDAQGQNRAFAVGTRGTYDLFNESTDPFTHIQTGLPAYSWILQPRKTDLVLIAWQLPISVLLFSVFAYAMSEHLQTRYLTFQAFVEEAPDAFNATAFWYGVSFPEHNGYRVVHDPVYTAYSNIGLPTNGPGRPTWWGIALLGSVALVGLIVLVLIVIRINGRDKGA